MDSAAVPSLVPVRMLNEYTYCPRLFHLEWVQSEWADNLDTKQGTWQHRVVDAPAGAAPAPEEADDLKKATSVQLSSDELGLVGKIDLLEPDRDGRVSPIEYKKGTPPDNPDRAWMPEKVQVCALALLLRHNGYRCDLGVIYYAETRQRVDVPITDELIETTLDHLANLRKAAESDAPPQPLVDSSKCPRCSLVGICLPDETNHLKDTDSPAPRRLIPSDREARPLYITEQGARVGKTKGRIEVKQHKEVLLSKRILDVSQVCLFGNIQVSTQALREFFRRDIPVCWFSYGNWFSGIGHGMPSKNVVLRIGQYAYADTGSVAIASRMISAKIRNSRKMLMRNSRDRSDRTIASLLNLAQKAEEAESPETLLGLEGTAARLYFGEFSTMIATDGLPGQPFSFEGRNRRPPLDPVNCLLSFCYSMLTKDATSTLLSVGFDPYLGVFHKPRFGRPALALDLMEEFRPLIAESVVLTVLNNGEIHPNDFVVRSLGVSLTQAGRKKVIAAYERRMAHEITHPRFGYKVSYRRTLEVQARILGAVLKGDLEEYEGFQTR